MSLADARRIAREKRVAIDTGADPAADKRKSIAHVNKEWTVRGLINDYREKILTGLGASTQKSYGRNLVRIENRLGALKVSQVSALDIVSMIEQVAAPWNESRMLLSTARMLFRHGAGRKIIPANPCIGIELSAVLGKRPATRRRLMLTEQEIKQLFDATMSPENKLALKILLGTAVRSDELRNAKWRNIDLDRGVWHIPSSKTGPGMDVPLSRPVRRWFSELFALKTDSEYVLPSRADGRRRRQGGDAPINPNTIGAAVKFWYEVHKPTDVRRFTPHDLRSTAKSHMRALGIPRDITEMCLNHKLSGIEGIYDVHTYFIERREALEKWGAFLERIESTMTMRVEPPRSAA